MKPTHTRLPHTVEAWHCPSDDAMWPDWLALAVESGRCSQRPIREGEWAVLKPEGTVAIYDADSFSLLYRELSQ